MAPELRLHPEPEPPPSPGHGAALPWGAAEGSGGWTVGLRGLGRVETVHPWVFLGTSQLVVKGLLHGLQGCVLSPAGPV